MFDKTPRPLELHWLLFLVILDFLPWSRDNSQMIWRVKKEALYIKDSQWKLLCSFYYLTSQLLSLSPLFSGHLWTTCSFLQVSPLK